MTFWRLLIAGLRDVKRDLGLVLMTSLVIGTLFFGLALVVDSIVFHLLIGEKVVVQAAMMLLVGSTAYLLLETARQLGVYRLKIQVTLAQQTALYQHLLKLPLSVYRAHDTAVLAQTAYQLSSSLGPSWIECLCLVVEMLPLFIGLCLWIPLWIVVSLAIISGLMIWLVTMLASNGWQRAQSSKAFYALTRSMIQSVAKLRISGNMASMLHYWKQNQQQHEGHVRRFAHQHDLVRSILSLGPAMLVMMWAQPDIAASFAAWLFFMRLTRGLQIVADLSSEWGVYRDFLTKTRTTVPHHTIALPILTGEIDVEDIVFRYQPSSDPVLNGVSLRIRAGQRAAIVGVSGAGKSTLLRLLAGIDQPESGSIRYDGCEVRQFEGFHQQIGVVLQDSKISAGSIWSNINGFTQYPIEATWAAARKATIAEVIEGLVMKMHTLVDEHAAILSRGQAQRLVLARALIHQPRILLLDEATSAVDDETQAKIFENLAEYTVIITAQRASTLQLVNVIYVLHEGRIAEQGPYQSLIEQEGVFTQLIQRHLI